MPPSPRLSLAARRLLGGLALLVTGALAAVGADPAGTGLLLTAGVEPGPPPLPAGVAAPPEAGERRAPRTSRWGGARGEGTAPRAHVVVEGQTARAIAERYGVATGALLRANAHVDPLSLKPGARLAVPDPDAPRPQRPQEALAAHLEVQRVLEAAADEHGVDPALAMAVAWVESRWDQHVVSGRGAIGVMQVQPATGETVAAQLGRDLDLHALGDNVVAGVAYLDLLAERYDGELRALLAAYHQGPRAVDERGIYAVSHRYVDDVLAARELFAAR